MNPKELLELDSAHATALAIDLFNQSFKYHFGTNDVDLSNPIAREFLGLEFDEDDPGQATLNVNTWRHLSMGFWNSVYAGTLTSAAQELPGYLHKAATARHIRFVNELFDNTADILGKSFLKRLDEPVSINSFKINSFKKVGLEDFLTKVAETVTDILLQPDDGVPRLASYEIGDEIYEKSDNGRWVLTRTRPGRQYTIKNVRFGARDGLILELCDKVGKTEKFYERKLTATSSQLLEDAAIQAFWAVLSGMPFANFKEAFCQDCVDKSLQFTKKRAENALAIDSVSAKNAQKKPLVEPEKPKISDEERMAQIRKEIPNFGKYA